MASYGSVEQQRNTSAASQNHPSGGVTATMAFDPWEGKIHERENGMHEAYGVTGRRQVSTSGPVFGTGSVRVEEIDGTTPRYAAKLDSPEFDVNVASKSDSVEELAFPVGAVEIEQHFYKGHVIDEHYGEVNDDNEGAVIHKDVPVYHKEVDEIIRREKKVNRIVERVPVMNYIDNVVEVEHIVDVPIIKEVPVKKTVVRKVPVQVHEQRLIEKVRYVPVTEEVEVEEICEIPGEVIVQPRHVDRDELIITDQHLDKEVPVVVSQIVKPIMKDTKKKVRVPGKILNPELRTASCRIPKPIDLEFKQSEVTTTFKEVGLSAADYNSAFFQLNQHLTQDHRKALTPGVHLHIDYMTGFPIIREEGNLKFYRLPDTAHAEVEGFNPVFVKPEESKEESSEARKSTKGSRSTRSKKSRQGGASVSKYITGANKSTRSVRSNGSGRSVNPHSGPMHPSTQFVTSKPADFTATPRKSFLAQ